MELSLACWPWELKRHGHKKRVVNLPGPEFLLGTCQPFHRLYTFS